uniref:Protein GrpE n=1 Tax=Eubacterium plexicaudatum ASF492 TaxID=1235802 RepID=N2BDH5_9FIRM
METNMDQMEEDILQDTEAEQDAAETPEDEAAQEAEEEKEEKDGTQETEENDEQSDAAEEAGQSGGKKGFFKKNKKKDKKDEKIEELTDQVKRQMAEFDNFRKRTEKEKTQMYEIGAKSIIEKVLPVVDNFERGLAAVPEENQDDAFVEGMNKIYKQIMTMLEEADVRPIEAIGKEFDPNLHNAVMQTESEEYETGIVAQELQKGYTYRDSVVRHSMVAVVS